MAGTATASKIDTATTRLCGELARIEAKSAADDARAKEIKKELLGKHGENFQVTIPGVGVVKLSAKRDKECTGKSYELDVSAFLQASQKDQDRLTEKGYVREVEVWKGAYYGSVSVDLF